MTGEGATGETGAASGEPAAALTDALVGIEALALARSLGHRNTGAAGLGSDGRAGRAGRAGAIEDAFVLFYTSTGVAALSGAALHGLFADRRHPVRRALWRLSLAAIGLSSLAAWRLGAWLALTGRSRARVEKATTGVHALYIGTVVLTSPPYAVAVASYVPGTMFLAWACTQRLDDPDERDGAALGLAGLGVTVAAAAIQVLRVRVGPRWLDSNTLYHLVQAGGLLVFHRAATRLIDAAARRGPTLTSPAVRRS